MTIGKAVFCTRFVLSAGNASHTDSFDVVLGTDKGYLKLDAPSCNGPTLTFIFPTRRTRDRAMEEIFLNGFRMREGLFDEIALRKGVISITVDYRGGDVYILDKRRRTMVPLDHSGNSDFAKGYLAYRECQHKLRTPKRQRPDYIKQTKTGFYVFRQNTGSFRLIELQGATRSPSEVWITNPEGLKRYKVTDENGKLKIIGSWWGPERLISEFVKTKGLGRFISQPYCNLANNIGRVPTQIVGCEEGSDEFFIAFDDGGPCLKFSHDQGCCEYVSIHEVVGDPRDLIGNPLAVSDEPDNLDSIEDRREAGFDAKDDEDEGHESFTWTFYRFAGFGGSLFVRWFGTSNGYYSESVDIEACTQEDVDKATKEAERAR